MYQNGGSDRLPDSWEIQSINTVQKYTQQIQLRNTVKKYSQRIQLKKNILDIHN